MSDFSKILETSEKLLHILLNYEEEIKVLLLKYQPVSITKYEIERCLYTLEHIHKLGRYFENNTGINVAVFLPSNLPLYSTLLFAIMPSFICNNVALRLNSALVEAVAIEKLFAILQLRVLCPNIQIVVSVPAEFLQIHVAKSELIIFTGTNKIKDEIKEHMIPESWLIYNGSGHNPIVVASDADIDKAVTGVSYTKFFNGGQDCAGPDAVFIHESIKEEFIDKLKAKVSGFKIGNHSDPETLIGKIHREVELQKLQHIIDNNKDDIIFGGTVDMDNKVVHPTIIYSHIENHKLNYNEVFGPILFLYSYRNDSQLALYFRDQGGKYAQNKMYVSLFGTSHYISDKNDDVLINVGGNTKHGVGKVLHDKIIHDLDIDNGTVPYGGYSKNASSIMHRNANRKFKSLAMPTLIPEIMWKIFTRKCQIKDLLARNIVKSEPSPEVKKLQKIRCELSKEFIKAANETFGSNVIFGFIFGSVAKGNCKSNASNINSFICLKTKEQKQVEDFQRKLRCLHEKYHFRIERNCSCEIIERMDLINDISHIYHQLCSSYCKPWLRDNTSASFRYSNDATVSAIHRISVLSDSKKIALINKDTVFYHRIVNDAQFTAIKLKDEIIQNVEKTETINLPQALIGKYPNSSNQEIAVNLKKLECYDILRLCFYKIDARQELNNYVASNENEWDISSGTL